MLDGGAAVSREPRANSRDGEPRALCVVSELTVEAVGDTGCKTVIENVSFQIRKGEYFALVGESGSGKSVTCHTLMQLLPFRANVSGRVVIDGADVFSLAPAKLRDFRRRSVGMIFQDPLAALNPVRTVGSQLIEALRLHYPSARRDELKERAISALTGVHVTQPGLRLTCYPHQLSGGLNQRVMIALALLGRPPLLIADEPTTALDMSVQAEILDLLDELRQSIGLSVLMVTHDLGIVADRATSVAVMRSGRIVESGAAATVLSEPRDPYTKALFEAGMVTRSTTDAPCVQHGAVCLSFDDVCKTFHSQAVFSAKRNADAVVAADDVSFTVADGEIVALVGESGSGKTTAAKIAMGLVRPDSGTVALTSGARPSLGNMAAQLVFQHPKDSLDPLMKVGAQLHEVLKVHGHRNFDERAALIRSVLADVGLNETLLDRRPTYLSGGEAQRVVIARALLLQPRLLIADEPLSAVDVCLQKQILDCFRSLRDKRGIAILLITHDLRVVLEIADRVVVMQNGCIVEDVPIGQFFDGQRKPYTQKLIDAMPGRDFRSSTDFGVKLAEHQGENQSQASASSWEGRTTMRNWMRLLRAVISLWLIVTLVFVGLRMTGDPAIAVLNPDDMTREMIDAYRKRWGFEGTIWEQYLVYILNIAHGNFGLSTLNGKDALDVVLERLPATLLLVGCSTLLMLLIGVPLGTLAAFRSGSRLDSVIMSGSTLGFALPNFFFGLLLILVFSVTLRMLPSGGRGTALHVILPVVTIGVAKAAIFTRFVRSAVLDALRLPCITAAKARGLSDTRILFWHVFPNSLIPLVTILPLLVGGMIGAASVVETVFGWPGVGRLIVESVAQRNLSVVQVIIMLVAAVMITTNLIVDMLYGYLDPRTKIAGAH